MKMKDVVRTADDQTLAAFLAALVVGSSGVVLRQCGIVVDDDVMMEDAIEYVTAALEVEVDE